MRTTKENVTLILFIALTIGIVIIVIFVWPEEFPERVVDSLLMHFIVVLATISALIFTIPLFFRSSREGTIHPRSDEGLMILYLCSFVLGIFSSLFTLLVENEGIKQIFFKCSLVLFLSCLVWLIPYLFVFFRKDIVKVMKGMRNSIIGELNHTPFHAGRNQEEKIKQEINRLVRITLQALNHHNYVALDYSISCLMDINCEIMDKIEASGEDSQEEKILEVFLGKNRIHTKAANSLIKEIMRSFRDLSIACVGCRSDEHSRQIGKHMKEMITEGLKNRSNFEYPNLVLNIEKLGAEAAKKHLEETTDEILNSLGQIGDRGIKTDLQCSPILAVLRGLQNIGVVCTEEKMIHQCTTARTRLIGIARPRGQDYP